MKSTTTKDGGSGTQQSDAQQHVANEGPPAKKQKQDKSKPGPKAGHRSEDTELYQKLAHDKRGVNVKRNQWQQNKLKQMTDGKKGNIECLKQEMFGSGGREHQDPPIIPH